MANTGENMTAWAPTRRPLTSRPMDLLYCIFFLIAWPRDLLPYILQEPIFWYMCKEKDPLIDHAMGILLGDGSDLTWFKSFLRLEGLFQLPVFVLGAFGLWRDTPRIYGLLALYGASTSTAALACLAMILDVPTTSAATLAQKVMSITSEQRELLLWRYVPFFIIPLCMGVDMAFRLHKLASAGMRAHYY